MKEAARVLGGVFEEGKSVHKDRVVLRRGDTPVTLDVQMVSTGSSVVFYSRARAHYPGFRELTVTVRRRHFGDRIVAALGLARDRLPLSRALLEKYVVKGKPRARVPSLFSAGVTEAVLAVPSLRLRVRQAARKHRKRLGDDTGEVEARTTGMVADSDWLVGLVRAVEITVEALARIGEITEPRG